MVTNGKVDGPYKDMWHSNKTISLHESLEDGTPAFHSIAALNSAFEGHRKLFGSVTSVAKHTLQSYRMVVQEDVNSFLYRWFTRLQNL